LQVAFVTIQNTKLRYLHSHPGAALKTLSNEIIQHRSEGSYKVLFIHGLGSSSERWLDIPDAISLAGFSSYAIDLPGFGGSQVRSDTEYNVNYLADITMDFIRSVDLEPEKTVLIGHSLGGFIAARLVSKFRIGHRLILIDSSGLLEHPTPLLERYYEAAMNPTSEKVRKVFEQMVADPIRIPEALVQGFIMRMGQENATHSFSSAYQNSTSTQLSRFEIEHLRSLNESVLLIWGEKDQLIPFEFFTRFSRFLPRAKTALVTDAGHAPFAEKPTLVFELIRSFLSASF